jgi:Membrane MotB of proton-channel complex MotA/MotB
MRRKSHGHDEEEGINTIAWMMSYADMATTLLAMFIVLSTLGKDQTGLSLYNGTGSFSHSLDNFGIPGLFPNSSRVIQFNAKSPLYLDPSLDADNGYFNNGTDAEARSTRIIDAEEERLQRFMQEIERQLQVETLPRSAGEAALDFYDALNKAAPYLPNKYSAALGQVLPLLDRENYRVYVIVWATMPSNVAWNLAAVQAQHAADEIASTAHLNAQARSRLIALGQPWRYANVRRPVMSLIISKLDQPAKAH